MLLSEGMTWHAVWEPLKKAIDAGQAIDLSFNVSGYAYDPETGLITVYGLTLEDGESHLTPENFRKNMVRFLKGTPECSF